MLATGHYSSPSSSLALDLLSTDFFPARECSFLTLVSFSSLDLPFAMLDCSSLDYVGGCLVREKMDTSMSKFKVFQFLCLL